MKQLYSNITFQINILTPAAYILATYSYTIWIKISVFHQDQCWHYFNLLLYTCTSIFPILGRFLLVKCLSGTDLVTINLKRPLPMSTDIRVYMFHGADDAVRERRWPPQKVYCAYHPVVGRTEVPVICHKAETNLKILLMKIPFLQDITTHIQYNNSEKNYKRTDVIGERRPLVRLPEAGL